MTEESYQACRKIMQTINYRRGMIAKAKGDVAKWTKIEDVHRRNLQEGQANGAKKALEKALIRLAKERAVFADLKFPDSNIKKEYVAAKCSECGCAVAIGNTICGECACEDDCDY